jgi:hypothetical protein
MGLGIRFRRLLWPLDPIVVTVHALISDRGKLQLEHSTVMAAQVATHDNRPRAFCLSALLISLGSNDPAALRLVVMGGRLRRGHDGVLQRSRKGR